MIELKTLLAGVAVMTAAVVIAGPLNAAQIILDPTAVIGDTGSYEFGSTATTHPGGQPAGRIFDQQTGSIGAEEFTKGYWVNGDNGPANAFITIDLGKAYDLSSFTLFNTSNGTYGDRGTGDFTIAASNSVVLDGTNGYTLAGTIFNIASGTLAAQATSGPLSARIFPGLSGDGYRYLQFRPTSVASANPIVNGIKNNYGLDELRVFGDAVPGVGGVPEPASWALLMTGFGAVGLATRRRRGLVSVTA